MQLILKSYTVTDCYYKPKVTMKLEDLFAYCRQRKRLYKPKVTMKTIEDVIASKPKDLYTAVAAWSIGCSESSVTDSGRETAKKLVYKHVYDKQVEFYNTNLGVPHKCKEEKMPDFKINCWYSTRSLLNVDTGGFDHVAHSHCSNFTEGIKDCYKRVHDVSGRETAGKLINEMYGQLGLSKHQDEKCWHIVIWWNDAIDTETEERYQVLKQISNLHCHKSYGVCPWPDEYKRNLFIKLPENIDCLFKEFALTKLEYIQVSTILGMKRFHAFVKELEDYLDYSKHNNNAYDEKRREEQSKSFANKVTDFLDGLTDKYTNCLFDFRDPAKVDRFFIQQCQKLNLSSLGVDINILVKNTTLAEVSRFAR